MIPAFLQTRVARRFFALFVLCAFVPLAAIGIASLSQSRDLMLEQGDQRLAATAKAYGMGVFERLTLAADVAMAVGNGDAAPGGPMALRMYRSLGTVDPDGVAVPIMGNLEAPPLSAADRARLDSGKPVVIVRPGEPRASVFLAVPVRGRAGTAMLGEVRTRYLWGPADELPTATEFCAVQDGSRLVMHCHAPGGEGAMREEAKHAPAGWSPTTTWERDGERHRVRRWSQFMGAAFGTSDWTIMASQPERHMLGKLIESRRIFIPVVLLALVLVTWVTMRQARHIVEPVARLVGRARSIGNSQFAERLDLRRNDEFGELGDAFDRMSHRLGRQFASLRALSQIDELILSTQDTTQIVRTILQRVGDMVTADDITLTIFERGDAEQSRTYYVVPGSEGGFLMDRQRVDPAAQLRLQAQPQSRWVDLESEEGGSGYLAHARAHGMKRVLVQPILWRGKACGVFAIGYREERDLEEEEYARVRELADRVAVAVSSAWRDEQLYQQAHFDPLTGTPNRLLFRDRLGIEIVRSQREGHLFALLFIDLDRFKTVNDSFGHSVGDLVLREAAIRIAHCIRASDTVARQGGDEFTVLVTNIQQPEEAWLIAESIVAALSREFAVGGQRCFLSASIGIASYPADGSTAEELLKCADTATHRAKAAGRAQVVFYEERMNAEAVARLTLDRDLRSAIDAGELVMHYQPQLELRTGAIVGCEALVRWHHPTRGLISPVRFIPLAEESGFIDQLGQWTLEMACRQMARWREEGIVLDHVAVNFSPRQFRHRNLPEQIAACVREAGLPPECLEIEITEGLLLDRGETVERALRDLASAGHGIALDDFGTGFSSMSYLKRLPVNTIKIDRIFIDGMEPGSDAEAIVAAVIAMSHALGKGVIAEGVETEEQASVLRRLRCDQIQGYLVSAALPPQQFAEFLRRSAQASPLRAPALHG